MNIVLENICIKNNSKNISENIVLGDLVLCKGRQSALDNFIDIWLNKNSYTGKITINNIEITKQKNDFLELSHFIYFQCPYKQLSVEDYLTLISKRHSDINMSKVAMKFFNLEYIKNIPFYKLNNKDANKVRTSELIACPKNIWFISTKYINNDKDNIQKLKELIILRTQQKGIAFLLSTNDEFDDIANKKITLH